MLCSLHIRNYILISSLDINFPKGLIIITGQTGAGKSILLGALSLLSGGKADASMLSAGADSCVVEAEYNVDSEEVKNLLETEDLDYDGGSIIIRRTISSSGRSRCFVNDSPVALGVLSELASYLVDIHSQHSSLLLANKSFQLSVLDNFASCSEDLAECRRLWKELQNAKNELAKLQASLSRIRSERDFDSAQLQQLEAAKLLAEDELELLDKEQKALANAEDIKEALQSSLNLFNPSDDNLVGLSQALKDSLRGLERISKYLPDTLPNLIERLEVARVEIEDISEEIFDIDSRIDISPERLVEVEDRMSLLYSLMKKHSCASLAELMAVREALKSKLTDSSSIEDRIVELEKHISNLESLWQSKASILRAKRLEAAPRLGSAIADDLHFLELEKSSFVVDVQACEPCADGEDCVHFLFSANGTKLADVSKVASGGELSRIMLCLKATMAKFMGMPTMIFDEIDTGVSGSVADKIGQMICAMGQNMQVLSITHLPQVAAKGNAHYVVSKSTDSEGITTSTLRRVEGSERVNEIARLLSGASISSAAIANAEILLNEGA